MTPREKEIALEAAGRSINPPAHAKHLLEAEAILSGKHLPFVVWPADMPTAEKAAWLEEQAAAVLKSGREIAEFIQQGPQGAL